MLTIENIDSLIGKRMRHWKVNNLSIGPDTYYVKVLHNGSPFDVFNLMIDRKKTKYGDYRIYCLETQKEHYLPIECIKDRDVFVEFLIDELI